MSEPHTQSSQVRIYRPDTRFEIGWLDAATALAKEIYAFRSHVATLFLADFRGSYRGTSAGVFWNIALPLLPVSVYILIVNLKVLPEFEGVSPAAFISFGLALWFLLTGIMTQPIAVVRSRNSELMKTAMPLSVAVTSSYARLLFDTLVRLALAAVVAIVTGSLPAGTVLLFPVVLGLAVTFFLASGLLLSMLNVIVPDLQRVITILVQYGLFFSGVIFPLRSMGPLSLLEVANPFSVFIHASRDIVFTGSLSHPLAFAFWSIAGIVLMIVAARVFYVMEYRIRGLA